MNVHLNSISSAPEYRLFSVPERSNVVVKYPFVFKAFWE